MNATIAPIIKIVASTPIVAIEPKHPGSFSSTFSGAEVTGAEVAGAEVSGAEVSELPHSA